MAGCGLSSSRGKKKKKCCCMPYICLGVVQMWTPYVSRSSVCQVPAWCVPGIGRRLSAHAVCLWQKKRPVLVVASRWESAWVLALDSLSLCDRPVAGPSVVWTHGHPLRPGLVRRDAGGWLQVVEQLTTGCVRLSVLLPPAPPSQKVKWPRCAQPCGPPSWATGLTGPPAGQRHRPIAAPPWWYAPLPPHNSPLQRYPTPPPPSRCCIRDHQTRCARRRPVAAPPGSRLTSTSRRCTRRRRSGRRCP